MAKKKSKSKISNKALNAFDTAVESEAPKKGRLGRNDRITLSEDEDSNDKNKELMNGNVANKDDEEIDSDEALGSDEDEEEFFGKFKGNRQQQEDDDDGGYDSIDENELLPLSAIWDLNEKRDNNEDSDDEEGDSDADGSKFKLKEDVSSEAEESESEEEEEDDDDDDEKLSEDEDSDDEINEDKLSSLKAQIADMSSNSTASAKPIMSRKERLQINRIPEGEYSLPNNDQADELSLNDLIENNGTNQKSKDNKQISTPLAVPLPKRIQERHDRTAAYDLTKEEVEKWADTVKQNREAEYLQFPINAPPQVQKNSIYTPMAPSTGLEKNIDNVIKASKSADDDSNQTETPSTFEELTPSKLSVEEVKKRRNELRMMREMMFRQEQKAKRVKKIKSKSYRKVHKKERERQNQMMEDDEGGSDAEEHDIKRAQERMNLRHKNTGKWAKNMIDQGFTKDKETRAELEEMLRRGEDLKKKIEGGGDNSDNDDDDDDENFLNNVDKQDDDEETRQSLGKGVMGMKFMRDAEERQRQRNIQDVNELRNAENETGFEELEKEGNSANQEINSGRRKFTPGTRETQDDMLETLQDVKDDYDEEKGHTMSSKLSKGFEKNSNNNKTQQKKSKSASTEGGDNDEEFNPWLALDESSQPLEKSNKSNHITKESTNDQKAQDKIRKQRNKKSGNSNASTGEDAIIDMNETLQMVDPLASDSEGDGDAEGNAEDDTMIRGKGKLMSFKQKELVKRAFSGDDVVADFQDEKKRKIEEEGDKEVDVTIPGWGSWGGNGSKQNKKKKFTKHVEGIKEKKRKDAKLKDVIINERVNKKNDKYSVGSVPFPFENREQYERSLRMPVGPEWASRDTHQRLTKPRVTVKQGSVIDPIKAPFKS